MLTDAEIEEKRLAIMSACIPLEDFPTATFLQQALTELLETRHQLARLNESLLPSREEAEAEFSAYCRTVKWCTREKRAIALKAFTHAILWATKIRTTETPSNYVAETK